eukprot:scaffold48096_cov33-Tisochrysis_lutea.AAC.3
MRLHRADRVLRSEEQQGRGTGLALRFASPVSSPQHTGRSQKVQELQGPLPLGSVGPGCFVACSLHLSQQSWAEAAR